MTPHKGPIVIQGAGAIGCYVGAVWAKAGCPVTLLGRASLMSFADTGLTASNGITVPPKALQPS